MAQTAAKPEVSEFAQPQGGALVQRSEKVSVLRPPSQEPATAFPTKIAKSILAIRRAIHPIAKDGKVAFGNVNYRYPKADDVMDEVIPLLAEHGLIITQSEVKQVLFETERMLAITYEYVVTNEDGDVWPDRIQRTGLAWVRSSKGEIDDKAANKASTQSEKWFYIKFFGIRTSDAAQLDNDAIVPGSPAAPAKPKPPKPGSTEAQAIAAPHYIPAREHSAETWAKALTAAIETAASGEQAAEWVKLNSKPLDQIKLGHPDLHAEVMKALMKKAGAQSASTKPKPPRPASEPANSMPSPETYPAEFVQWLDGQLGQLTVDNFEAEYNERLAPLVDRLDPVHQEDAMGIYRKHEARLGG